MLRRIRRLHVESGVGSASPARAGAARDRLLTPTYLGAVYANLFPGRVRALAFDRSMDFVGNATGHDDEGTTKPLDTRQDTPRGITETFDSFLRQCSAAGPRCAFSSGDPKAKWVALAERARQQPILIEGDTGHETNSVMLE